MFNSANVTLMVRDLDRSIDFYTETLGLDLGVRHGAHWAEVIAPGVTIGLHPGGSGAPQGSSISIGLMIDDFTAAIATLRERGVSFDRVTEDARASSAYFSDPDGFQLYVMSRAEASKPA